jgi:predicted DsbA family dithiol-disulfide isomerase
VKDVGLDVEAWHKAYIDRKTFDMMLSDFERAYGYGVTGVPTLVANSRYGLVGAQKYETIKKWLEKIIQRELLSR